MTNATLHPIVQRLLIILVCLAVLPGAAASAQSPPELGSEVTISGSSAGYTEVRIPADLAPFDGDLGALRLTGGGAVIGAVLRYAEPIETQRPDLTVLKLGNGSGTFVSVGGGSGLPAGRYRLYLLANAPGSATLEFPRLDGEPLSLSPEKPAPYAAGPLPQRLAPPTHSVYGRTPDLTHSSLALSTMRLGEQAAVPMRMEGCSYPGGDAKAGGGAYGPTCPPDGFSYATTAVAKGDGLFSVVFGDGAPWGLGGNLTTSGVPARLDTLGMWVSFAPEERRAPATPEVAGGPPSSGTGQSAPAPSPAHGALGGATPVASGGPSNASTAPGAGSATLASTRARVRRGRAPLAVRCVGPGTCSGTARLSGGRPARFVLPAGRTATLRVAVPRGLARRMRRASRRGVRTVAIVQSIAQDGAPREERRPIRLSR